jgi:hypothetical protein
LHDLLKTPFGGNTKYGNAHRRQLPGGWLSPSFLKFGDA